jgi:uncharacterized membrane protein YoaK (UPF0700 family)
MNFVMGATISRLLISFLTAFLMLAVNKYLFGSNFTVKLNFDSKKSKNSQIREKLKRKTDVPPQLSIEGTL